MHRDRYSDISALVDNESTQLGFASILTAEDLIEYLDIYRISKAIQYLEPPNPTDPDLVIGSVLDKIDRNPLLKIF